MLTVYQQLWRKFYGLHGIVCIMLYRTYGMGNHHISVERTKQGVA